MASLGNKVKVGDIIVFNGLDNAAQFEVIDFVWQFGIKIGIRIREVDTDYVYQFTDVGLIHSIVKKGSSK